MSVSRTPVAFYTPLKHPQQAEASGDREIGRDLVSALAACGLRPALASRLATWRRQWDPAAVVRVERAAALTVRRLVGGIRRRPAAARPRLWMTYQNYYRCPDLVGPGVTAALEIPYVLVDTALSRRSRATAFRPWVSAARLAVRQAALIFAMSPRDLPRLAAFRGPRFAAERLMLLPPAVDLDRFPADEPTRRHHRAALRERFPGREAPVLLCVAMMRTADKLDSYRLLAAALADLAKTEPPRPWRLLIVGDGPARREVEAAFGALPPDRVRFTGALEPAALPPLYLGADCLVFPGLGEALGLVYLEAAAAGLPVVACRGPGPEFTVAPGGGLLTDPTAPAFAEAVARLLDGPTARRAMGDTARRFAAAERSMDAFVARLRDGLSRLDWSPSP